MKNEDYSNKLLLQKINLAIRWAQDISLSASDTEDQTDEIDGGKPPQDMILSSEQKNLLHKIIVEFENLQQKINEPHGVSKDTDSFNNMNNDNDNNDELAQQIQSIIFHNAKSNNLQPKEVFRLFYQILINSERGPRLGNYIADLGISNVIPILAKKIT